jgi:two-component system chemotaxis response regulator CheB
VPNRNLIVIGASAGGIEALQQICARLPANLNAAVVAVMHTSIFGGGLLPNILSRAGPLPASHPRNREEIKPGHIYVPCPDQHLIVEPGRLLNFHGPRENNHRPAIDPTFRSAALAYGRRAIGVILTGMLDDGTAGLMILRAHRGVAVVQDPQTALFPSMPKSALQRVPDAHVVSLEEMPQLLAKLVAEQVPAPAQPLPFPDVSAMKEVRIAELDMAEIENEMRNGKPSQFGCPACGGVLWEIDDHGMLRYRCRVGHAYTARHLRAEQRQAVETALWSALRALEERASLYRRMAQGSNDIRHEQSAQIFEERARNAEANSETLRDFLVQVNTPEADIEEGNEETAAEAT